MTRKLAIINVRVFNGADKLIENGVIVVSNNRIEKVGKRGDVEIPEDSQIIDGKGMTAIPGLIDAHIHVLGMKTGDLVKEPLLTPIGVFFARAVRDLEKLLNAGYTTIRDMGGVIALHLKHAVEEGVISGPRILAAGYPISQTFGHGDVHYLPVEWVDARYTKKLAPLASLICDGVEECRRAARYALREGADFLKIFTTGGVLSQRDKPEYTQFTVEEIKAIVDEAAHVGTFVASHAQGAQGIKNAIRAGVKTIEHAIYIDDEGIELARERDVIIIPTLSIVQRLIERGSEAGIPEWGLRKSEEVYEIHISNMRKAVKEGVKVAAGTDFFGGVLAEFGENSLELELMVKKLGLTPLEAIRAATIHAAEACNLHRELGSIEPGKIADVVLVEGNPLDDIKLLRDPGNVKLVLKEGKIVKNTLKSQ